MVGSRGFFAVLGVATLLSSAAAEEQSLSSSPDRADYVVVDKSDRKLYLFIGPEGGWTDDELSLFDSHHIRLVALTATILRIETAAITAAAVLACHRLHLQSHVAHRQSPVA